MDTFLNVLILSAITVGVVAALIAIGAVIDEVFNHFVPVAIYIILVLIGIIAFFSWADCQPWAKIPITELFL